MDSFILYAEQWPAIALLDDHQKAALMQAMFALHGACDMPDMDSITQAIFLLMKPRFEANTEKYKSKCETNRINGKNGGRPRKEKTECLSDENPKTERFLEQNRKTLSYTDSDTDSYSDFKKIDTSYLAQSDAEASSAPEPEPEPCIANIPLADRSEWGVPESFAAELSAAYPAVPVPEELARCRAWCLANPKNCKTKAGIRRFVNSWFSRAQDKAPVARASPPGGDNRTWAQKREAEVMQEFLQGA